MDYFWIFRSCRDHQSIKHCSNFVVEGLIIKVLNFNSLEVLFRIEVSFGDQESLPQHQFLNFSIIIVHDIIIDITFLFLIDFQEVGDLFGSQLLPFIARRLVVHHFVELGECLRVVLIWTKQNYYIFPAMLRSLSNSSRQWSS